MKEIKIVQLTKGEFIRTFHKATLSFSKTPWVQENVFFFGKLESSVGTWPILISQSTIRGIKTLLFRRNCWKPVETNRKVPKDLLDKELSFILGKKLNGTRVDGIADYS